MTEAEIGRVVVAELQRQGYETYEEVEADRGRADVIGRRGPLLVVVECKQALSLRLLDQVVRWNGYANRVIAAIEDGRFGDAVRRLARADGFGLWRVSSDSIHEDVSPRLLRRTEGRLAKLLRDEQRSGAYAKAGTTGGGYWTPFQSTIRALRDLVTVKGRDGIELREALKAIDHHYATDKSARSHIPKLIASGVITGLRVEGRPLRLFAEQSK